MTLRPLRDLILVELEQDPTEERLSYGGIILLPPKEEERQSIGRVLAVGPGKWDDNWHHPMDRKPVAPSHKFAAVPVKVGERVAFSKYGPKPVPGAPLQRILSWESVHYVLDAA